MLAGYLLLGIVPPLVRAARSLNVSSTELVLIRFIGGSLFFLLLARTIQGAFSTKQPRLLLLRGLLGACAVQLYFLGIQLSGAGVGTLLNYSYPLWANLLGVFFGERPSARFWPLLGVALVGIYLVVDPQVSGVGPGELAGILSAVFAGGAVLSIKRLRRTDSELLIVGSFSLIGALLAAPIWLLSSPGEGLFALSLPAEAYVLAGAMALLSFWGQLLFTRGFKGTTLQWGTMLSLTVPLVATLLGVIFLNEPLSPRFVIGGSLVLASCAALGLHTPDKAKPPTRTLTE
jgi:drug/metabolite transporter (DMT)-like permease